MKGKKQSNHQPQDGGYLVYYYPKLAIALDSVEASLFLSYFLSICEKESQEWVYGKTVKEIEEATALSPREQKVAKDRLKKLGILEEKKKGGLTFYKFNWQKVCDLLKDIEENY